MSMKTVLNNLSSKVILKRFYFDECHYLCLILDAVFGKYWVSIDSRELIVNQQGKSFTLNVSK